MNDNIAIVESINLFTGILMAPHVVSLDVTVFARLLRKVDSLEWYVHGHADRFPWEKKRNAVAGGMVTTDYESII